MCVVVHVTERCMDKGRRKRERERLKGFESRIEMAKKEEEDGREMGGERSGIPLD